MENDVEVFGWRYKLISDIKKGDKYELTLQSQQAEVKMTLSANEYKRLMKVKFITYKDLEEDVF